MRTSVKSQRNNFLILKKGKSFKNFLKSMLCFSYTQAARLGLISVSQMATAYHLREALVEFREEDDIRKNITPLKQHVFTKNDTNDFSNPKEPFKFFNISYATKENSIDFQERIKKLPDNERSYFSINLSKRREIAFLYDGLASSGFYKKNKNFNTILQHYLKRQPSENVMPVIGLLSDLDSSDKEKSASAAKMLRAFILRQEPNQQDFLEHKLYDKNSIKDRDSSRFLINLLEVKEQLPNIALSPDATNDPNTPLLCMVVLAMRAFVELQQSVHGENHATNPFFTAGQVTTRLIAALNEMQARTVEVVHPDTQSTQSPHGADAHNFILTWHDILHCWRNGAIMCKPFIRQLQKLLREEKGFDMSKPIWGLADMDFSGGRLVRDALKQSLSAEDNLQNVRVKQAQFVQAILDRIAGKKIKKFQHLRKKVTIIFYV